MEIEKLQQLVVQLPRDRQLIFMRWCIDELVKPEVVNNLTQANLVDYAQSIENTNSAEELRELTVDIAHHTFVKSTETKNTILQKASYICACLNQLLISLEDNIFEQSFFLFYLEKALGYQIKETLHNKLLQKIKSLAD